MSFRIDQMRTILKVIALNFEGSFIPADYVQFLVGIGLSLWLLVVCYQGFVVPTSTCSSITANSSFKFITLRNHASKSSIGYGDYWWRISLISNK